MAENTLPGVARLEEARNRIGHNQQPQFSIPAGIFDKSRNAKTYTHDESLIQQAKATGWVELYKSYDANKVEETWTTHLALQDFGVGIYHRLYDEMIRKFAPRRHAALSKEQFVDEFKLRINTSNLSNIHHKDLLSMAILTHITRHYFDNHGEIQMLMKESQKVTAIDAEIKDLKQEEEEHKAARREGRFPPRRTLPGEHEARRAKARRLASGHAEVAAERGNTIPDLTPSPTPVFARTASAMSPQNPFATPNSAVETPRAEAAAPAPSSVSRTPRAATTSQHVPYAHDSIRNQDEEDETLDDFDEFNPS